MKKEKPVPTAQELEILKVVWERGSATVREVFQDLQKKRKIAYTTVLTMMGILERKGHLTKKTGDRAYVYRPARSRDKVMEGLVADFVDRVFNGSRVPLLMHLIEDREVDTADLDEIEAALRDRRKKQ